MGTVLVTPPRSVKASPNRDRSWRAGPILSLFLRETHLALILLSAILGGGRCVSLNSPNRDAPSHFPAPPPPSPSQPPPAAAPRPRGTSSAGSNQGFWGLDVTSRAPSRPLSGGTACPSPRVSPGRGEPAAGTASWKPPQWQCRAGNTSHGTTAPFPAAPSPRNPPETFLTCSWDITVRGKRSCAGLPGTFTRVFFHSGDSLAALR